MRRVLLLTAMTAVRAFALERQELTPLVESATTKKESAYVEVRDKIVGLGTNALPLLAEIAVDEALPWQQRLVARICYERIERKEDIKKLIETNWHGHPDFDPEWNKLITGPEKSMALIITPEMKKAGLWYYYLEREWKMTGEDGEIHKGKFSDTWVGSCIRAVKDNPEERIWFLRVWSEVLEDISPNPTPYTRDHWLYRILEREEKPDTAYLLEHRTPPPVTSEPPFRLGTKIIKPAK